MKHFRNHNARVTLLLTLLVSSVLSGCGGAARNQVSYLGPEIEGVRQIFLASPDGSNQVQLFSDVASLGTGLVWGPDGEQAIVFAGPDRSARLADPEAGTLGPCVDCAIPSPGDLAFSPNGGQVAVGSSDGLYVVNLENLAHQLVSDLRRPGWIQWLGSENQIGFWERPDRIYVVDVSTGNLTNLTEQYGDSDLVFFAPQWSRDGRMLAMRTSGEGGFGIHVMNSDGSNLRRVADYMYRGEFLDFGALSPPQWSPNGEQLLFSSFTTAGDTDIFVVNGDGTGLKNLTNSPGADVDPSWSPDGRQIAFVTSRDGNDEIYVMNADGSQPINISNTPLLDEFSPGWRPQD